MVLQTKYLIFLTQLLPLLFKNFIARLAQTNLARKSDIANFVKRTDFDGKLKQKRNKKVTSNKTKHDFLKMN